MREQEKIKGILLFSVLLHVYFAHSHNLRACEACFRRLKFYPQFIFISYNSRGNTRSLLTGFNSEHCSDL